MHTSPHKKSRNHTNSHTRVSRWQWQRCSISDIQWACAGVRTVLVSPLSQTGLHYVGSLAWPWQDLILVAWHGAQALVPLVGPPLHLYASIEHFLKCFWKEKLMLHTCVCIYIRATRSSEMLCKCIIIIIPALWTFWSGMAWKICVTKVGEHYVWISNGQSIIREM